MRKNRQVAKQNTFTEFLLYTTPNGKVKVEIFLRNENIWLTQDRIALLFGVQRPAITKHLKNIFESGELQEDAVSNNPRIAPIAKLSFAKRSNFRYYPQK